MKSAVLHEIGNVSLDKIPVEPLKEGDIRIKVKLCGVCGSDIKSFVRGTPYSVPPVVLGHEVVGVVEESKNKRWKKGDRVAVAHYIPCESCEYCLAGKGTLCPELFTRRITPGGFSEYLRIPKDLAERGTFEISDDTSFHQVVLAEPLACCIHGANIANIGIGSTVLIIGDGPMGLLHSQIASLYGARKVIMSGMTPHRLKVARKFSDHVFDASKVDLKQEINKVTNNLGPDVIIVAVPSAIAAEQAIDIIRPGGTLLLFGGFEDGVQLKVDPNRIHYDEIDLVGSVGSLSSDFATALKLLESDKIDIKSLFTKLYSLDNVPLALERGAQQEGIKSIVNPWAPKGTDVSLTDGGINDALFNE